MYHMLQKCSYIRVLEVFFKEPTRVHFIREISRKINLATTSIRNYIKELEKEGLIKKEYQKPFMGYIAQRDNEKFIHYKQIYNLYSLLELKNKLINDLGPKIIILFGSYQKGEDRENSDIDLLVLSKVKNSMNLKKFEDTLKRKIHITFVSKIKYLDEGMQNNIKNGWVLYGKI